MRVIATLIIVAVMGLGMWALTDQSEYQTYIGERWLTAQEYGNLNLEKGKTIYNISEWGIKEIDGTNLLLSYAFQSKQDLSDFKKGGSTVLKGFAGAAPVIVGAVGLIFIVSIWSRKEV